MSPSATLKRYCSAVGCNVIVEHGKCADHRKAADALDRERRGNSSERLYGSRWQRARKRFIQHYPLCKPCQDEGRVTLAYAVDHIKPHRGNLTLFWDQSNWQPMCESHHNSKARSERLSV